MADRDVYGAVFNSHFAVIVNSNDLYSKYKERE